MKSKFTTVILVLSLAINLIILGAAVGFWLREPAGPKFPSHLGNVLQDVDPKQRQQMRQRFKEFREESRPLHRTVRREQRALAKIILAEPFDKEAALEAFATTRDARAAVQTHMFEQMVEVMGDLDRRQRAEMMRRVFRDNMKGNMRKQPRPPEGN